MSSYAWIGVIGSALVTTMAIAAYVVMALPYFDNAPFWTELRRKPYQAAGIGLVIYGFFFAIFYVGALLLDQDTSGPLLLFSTFVMALPFSLLLGSETWDRRNGHGMNQVSPMRAVTVATGIGLAELVTFSVAFIVVLQFAS